MSATPLSATIAAAVWDTPIGQDPEHRVQARAQGRGDRDGDVGESGEHEQPRRDAPDPALAPLALERVGVRGPVASDRPGRDERDVHRARRVVVAADLARDEPLDEGGPRQRGVAEDESDVHVGARLELEEAHLAP